MTERNFQAGQGRVFLQSYGAGPSHVYDYLGCSRMMGFSQSLGDITKVECPSPAAYDRFDVVDEVRGDGGLPTTSLVGRFGLSNEVFTEQCPFDAQVHYGLCQDPTNFNGGWDTILAFERGRFTNVSSDDLTALEQADRAPILLTGDITARAIHQINKMVLSEGAADEATREVVDIVICDWLQCGDCGTESGGCSTIYAITNGSGLASPGLPAELLSSTDGGQTWTQNDITTLATGENPNAIACVGDYVVVVSEDSGSLHYAPKSDLTDWTEVAIGFVTGPIDIFALSATQVWIVGAGGYIYFTDDFASGVVVQNDGTAASTNDLLAVHAYNSQNVVAVGQLNTVVATVNGGLTWTAITGPVVGSTICPTVWMRSEYTWLVGVDGELWYTGDAGATWVEKLFPGSGTGVVRDVVFSIHNGSPFGFMSHDTTAPAGRILRTLDGGNSWYILPEGTGAIPANDRITKLAACRDPNKIAGGGLGDDGEDGIIVIGQ